MDSSQSKVQAESNYTFQINLYELKIPANSKIIITFPDKYPYSQQQQIQATPVIIVYQDKYNGTIKDNILTIQEAFNDDINANFDFTILNITNPKTSGSYTFIFTIENENINFDYSSSATVIINPGKLNVTAKFNPNVTNSISQLNIQVTPQHQIPQSGKLRIKIKKIWSQFQGYKTINNIQTTATCQNSIITSINLRCNQIQHPLNFTIIVNDIFEADHYAGNIFSITINNVLSPPTVLTSLDKFTIETLDDFDNTIDTNQVQIQQLVATTMISTTFNQANIIVGTNITQLSITIQFQQIIIPIDTIQFKFPQSIKYEKQNVSLRGVPSIFQSSSVEFNDAQKKITFTLNFSPGTSIIQNQTIFMYLLINITIPWTTQPNQITITFKRNDAQYLKGTGTLTPQTNNLDVKLQLLTTQINKSTKYEFQLNPESIMNSSAYLNITFPDQINIQNASNCMKKTINDNFEIPCQFNLIQDQSIIITNLFETGYSNNNQFYVSFENIKNPIKVKNIGPFYITTFSSQNQQYKIDYNQQLIFNTTYGILDTTKIEISSDSQVVYFSTIYTIKLTILNEVSKKKSQIHIQFPTQFQIEQLNKCFVNSSKCNCQKDTSNQKIILFNFQSTDQTFNSGQEIEIKIGNIRNPKSTQRVNGINIKIYNDCQQQDSCSDSNLQDIVKNLFYMVNKPSQLNLTINPQQKTNGQQIKYFFNINFDYPIENNNILQITFSKQMSVTNNPNCSLNTSQITTQLPLKCKYQASSRILTININSTQNILGLHTISVQRIKNAKSFKQNELKLELFLSDGITIVQKKENFSFSNTKTGQINNTNTEFQFNPRILGQESNITMNVAINNSLDSNCFMEVKFPDFYNLNDALKCNDDRILCSKNNNYNYILIISIIQNNIFDDFLNFTVSTITNPLQFLPYKADFLIRTYQKYPSQDFPIDQGNISYQFKKQCQNACRTCSSNQQDFCLSCYNNTLITNKIYLQQNKCVQDCKDTYYKQNQKCQKCFSPCYTCSTNQTCLSCDLSGQFSYFLNNNCFENCPVNYFSNISNISKICEKCQQECFKCTSKDECSQCSDNHYLQDKQCLDQCDQGYFEINLIQGGNCSKCSQQCKLCVKLPNNCTQCSDEYIQITINNTLLCVKECPNETQAIDNGTCKDCQFPCKTCKGSINNCSSCNHNQQKYKYLNILDTQNNICSNSCQIQYYADSNFICIKCPGNCYSCNYSENIINCSSCKNQYKLQIGECLTDCTPYIYVEDGNECKPCQGQCQTCQNITTNCTSCKTKKLNNNSCVQNCPDTKVPVNKICTQCQSPCLHCKNSVSQCTKCKAQNYLFQNKCLPDCPDGFYNNSVNGENGTCQKCITNCINCQNSKQCIQCYPSYFLQKLICVSQCTQGYENDNVCSKCENKCKKCSHPDACVQCYQGFLLAEDGICYDQCPEQYPVQQDKQCVKCPSDCIQCDSKGMCLQCGINFYVFKGKCVSQCPQFYQLSADKNSCQLNLQNSLNAFTRSPFPILIVTGICLASIFVSKLQTSQTILSACIVGFVSILQLSAWLYLLILYSSSITELNKQIILLITGICFLIILNIVHFVFYFKFLSKDQTFSKWKQKKWNRISNCVVLIFSLFTFKAYHLIYSRYFGFEIFFASWKKITLLFYLDALGIISIFLNSMIMIIGASLIAIQQNEKNYFSQVFIQSLQVIIVQAFMIIFLICNCKKNEKMFKSIEKKYTTQYTINNLEEFGENQQYMQIIQDNNKNIKKNNFNSTIKNSKDQQKQECLNKIDQCLHKYGSQYNNNQDQLKQYTLKDQQKNQINQKMKNKKKNKKKKTKQSTQKGKGQNQEQNIQHFELPSVDNKKKTIQQQEIQEIKNKIQNLKKNINPAISKQKPNKLNKVPFISYQETKQINKNHLNYDDDPSFLQNKMIQDQNKIKKILKSHKKVNNNYISQSQIQNKQQQKQQNSNSKLKKYLLFFENQQSNNGNQINHTKEGQIYKQIDFKQMTSQYLNNIQFEDEISPNQQKHNHQYLDQKFTNLQNKINNNYLRQNHDDKKNSQIILQNKNLDNQNGRYFESHSQNDLELNQISPSFFNQTNQRLENELFENKNINKNKELNCQQIKIDPMQNQDYQYEEVFFNKPSNIKKKQVDNQQPFQLKRHQNYFQRNKKQQQQMIVDYPMPNFQNQRYEQNYKQQKDHGKQNNNRLKSLQKIYLQRLNVKNKSIPKQFYKK